MSTTPRAVLDACVLFPSVLRELLLDLAQEGAFTPLWSERILAEWQVAANRRGPEAAACAQAAITALRIQWPDAEIPAAPSIETRLNLPDPADHHVLATAIAARAQLIVTRNLRDFPARALAPEGVKARAPDDLLMEQWLTHPGRVERAVARCVARTETASGRTQPARPLLRRAGLPRLGKALG